MDGDRISLNDRALSRRTALAAGATVGAGFALAAQPICAQTVITTPADGLTAGEVKAQELMLAKQLIEQTATDVFEPAKYRDTVRERVMEAIQRKIEGQDITADVTPDGGGKIIDLMEALKASLAQTAPDEKEPERKVS